MGPLDPADKIIKKSIVGSPVDAANNTAGGTPVGTDTTSKRTKNIDGTPSFDVLAARALAEDALGGAQRTTEPAIRYPKLAKLIDSAENHLALHLVHLRDIDTVERLIAAQGRGVQTQIVVTKKDRLSYAERMSLLALEGAGVDIVVRKKTELAARAGLI